ncbi:MAG TPA: amidohydrolase family protein, partial [Paenirhodobacter sp.]
MTETIEILNARDVARGPISIRLSGGQIGWVGPAADMPATPAPVRRIDAGGAWLLPGLCESHLHLFAGGVTLDQLNLLGVERADAMARALAAYRQGRHDQPLLGAWSANYEILGPGTRPDRHALDRMVPYQPLLVLAVDLHTAWANTAALVAAGLMDHVPDVTDAEVVIGPDGTPTGELREGNAMQLVARLSGTGGREGICMAGDEPVAPTADDRARDKAALRQALDACAAFGITTAVN